MAVLNIEQLPFGTSTKTVLRMFSDAENTMPKMFFYNMFGKAPGVTDFSDKETVSIEIERYGEKKAVDVVRGGVGNLNVLAKSTEKIYIPPLYDEYTLMNAFELNKRMPGELPTDATGNKVARMLFNLTKRMLEMRKRILRAMEFMSVEALWNGIINLINTESIDFKRKASHNITPAFAWTDQTNGDPIADLTAACYVNRIDGKVKSDIAFLDTNAMNLLINHTKVKAYLDNRRIEPGMIRPVIQEAAGVTYQGYIFVGDYRLDLYTYPEYYQDDTGTYYAYLPDDSVIVMSSQTRLDKSFGAIGIMEHSVRAFNQLGVRIPQIVQGDFIPYYQEEGVSNVRAGVQSAPIVIPTQIDGITRLNVG